MKKNDQAQTFSITRKPIKVDGKDVRMSPAQLYHRLFCIARTNGPPDPCIFSSEMTAVAPALFKEDGSMRTSQKSQLAKHIVGKDPNITRKQYDNSAGRVYDGCALIHRLAWPKVGTMRCGCETCVGYVLASAAPDVQVCVVFDCYDQQTAKAPGQKRRRLKTGSYPDVVLEHNTPVPGNKEAFLGNMDVVVIAYDTDILGLPVYRAHSSHQFYMETKQHMLMFAGACSSCMRWLDVTQRLKCLASERRRPLRRSKHRKNFRQRC